MYNGFDLYFVSNACTMGFSLYFVSNACTMGFSLYFVSNACTMGLIFILYLMHVQWV